MLDNLFAAFTFGNTLFAITTLTMIIAFGIVLRSLQREHDAPAPKWTLTESLMEEVEFVTKDENDKEITKTEMKPSSSRLIALIGTVGIMVLYMGFGLAALKHFSDGETVASLEGTADYFLAGIVLFAPYIVNKFSSVFDRLKT